MKIIVSFEFSSWPDKRVWCYSISGNLTSKSALDRLRHAFPITLYGYWTWDPCIPPWRSTLVWCAIFYKITTADRWMHRGFYGPSICWLCRSESESMDHVFCTCPFALQLWVKLFLNIDVHFTNPLCYNELLLSATKANFSPKVLRSWKVAAVVTLSLILWSTKNRFVHEGLVSNVSSYLVVLWSFIKETNNINTAPVNGMQRDLLICRRLGLGYRPPRPTKLISCRWIASPPGWIKINFDCCTNGSHGLLFGGVICRNCRGFSLRQ